MPYLWAAGIAGDVSVGATSGATIDADFDDILENLEAGLMLAGEVHFAGGFGLLADVTWMDLAGNASGPLGARSVHGTTEMLHAQLSAMWRLEPQAGVGLDFLTGVRLVDIEAGLDTSSIAASVSETLIDPVVGLRLTVPIGDRFQAQAYGDVGGFGVGTDLSYQLYATLEWKLSRAIGLEAGWRHLGIDFDEPELAMDVVFSGPLLGMRITL